ncbi:3-hydroxyacyl-CoA dehydrogenase NAD-binding domain-containing protein [Rhizobiaceae bacterium BDR2-2]|uniref:3-hydroxyacyl-CoA dehydrogenase NAD-binding domain-containing protein n=1 Tax=Ectorhizobium quercum TaxID=2965071 RepID=A0AAE3MY74_9HYPH|nr:3-hydroxyacyl-CoA dehydrogenase NAD-binding domain-containing protein [Ectorhizobium quercum]MCX8997144.1 3-hydroxyacyl-CoA dehydrogenase NAD-binding domain-containing protein [Ectorhizobium quercum]
MNDTPAPLTFAATVSGRIVSDVLIVTIDNPPVNATSAQVRAGLVAALNHAARDGTIRAVVLTGAGKVFIGGADIREFGKAPLEPSLPTVIDLIEKMQKPVVAALNGAALGGGLEVALAAHGRIAIPDASFALPEVKLGIVPGAGGTQRLPRLVGALAALDLAATGRTVKSAEALALGLVDRICDAELMAEAVAFAISLTGSPIRRTGMLAVAVPDTRIFAEATKKIVSRARGAHAPGEAARLVGLSFALPFEDAVAEERATFLRLRDSEEAAALRHLFFAERNAGKVEGLCAEALPLSTIGIAGIGLMGSGIAAACLAAGYKVVGYEPREEAAIAGQGRISDLLRRAVIAGKMTREQVEAGLSNLEITTHVHQLAEAGLVIEAVFDDFDAKANLFRQLDRLLKPDTLLATNTSYLDPDALAAVTSRPERFLGLHFFSPANIMRLVEVVRCAETADTALATGIAFARKIGKLPIVTGVCEGFIGNRIFSAYRAEAEKMLAEGASPEVIDRAMEAYGFAMGLFTVNDMAGLEIAWARRKRTAASRDPAAFYFDVPDRLCEAGRFGARTGRGWYDYSGGARAPDPDVAALIEDFRTRKGIVPRNFTEAEIMDRLLSAMSREGRALTEEGIARHEDDIDLILVNGYGFPAARGGPMFAASRRKT